VLTDAESLKDDRVFTSIAAYVTNEALAEQDTVTSIAVITDAESLADTAAGSSLAIFTDKEALADLTALTSVTVLTDAEALKDDNVFTSVAVPTENWKLISSGLSGVSYDQAGSVIIPSVEIIVFKNSDDSVYYRGTTDASGYWFTQADPNFTYWMTYWKGVTTGDRSANVGWRTDRAIASVDTVIATGT
jgi:hypothetical protein